MEIQRIAKILSRWASEWPEIATVYLFGSRVKGTHRQGSDLDIAVEFDPSVISVSEADLGRSRWFLNKGKWEGQIQSKIPIRVQLDWFHPEMRNIVGIGLAEASIIVYNKKSRVD